MAEVTMTAAGTVHSTFQPSSNTNLPPTAALVPDVKVTVAPPGSDPDKGLKVTEVKVEVTALGSSGTASGRVQVYHKANLLFTLDVPAAGASQTETTSIVVKEGDTTAFTVKWFRLEAGTYLPANEKVVLSVSSEDWVG